MNTDTITYKDQMVANAAIIDSFFGGWKDDPRTTEEIIKEIRELRTANTPEI